MNCFGKNIALTVFFLFSVFSLMAGDLKYPVAEIPPELLRNANMVVRHYETSLVISSLTNVVQRVHLVITVLREGSDDEAALVLLYNKTTKINSLAGRYYNALGIQTSRIRQENIIDQSAVSAGDLYSDDRVKFVRPLPTQYPYTVEYEYERTFCETMHYPVWSPVDNYHVSLESARLLVSAAKGAYPRFRAINLQPYGTGPELKSDSTLVWELNHFTAMIPEPLSDGISQIVPLVYLEPGKISIQEQDPLPASWNAYGKWINWLNSDRGTLPEPTQEKIRQLVSGIADPLEKMKTIYHYFQENTRYINVKIGIGGFQPVEAAFVARTGYGDCKALTNYLKSLLQCAGIRSVYTLVRSGKWAKPLMKDFPSLQFNHAFLCVPMEKDTVWLECTSQVNPFGFLGSFTDDRDVLLITPEGGILAHTPECPGSTNWLHRKGTVALDSAGNAQMVLTTRVSGLEYELIEPQLRQSAEEQKKSLREEIGIPTVNITRLHYQEEPNIVPVATETLEMTIPGYATSTGDRVFIPVNTLNRELTLPQPQEVRKLPFYPGKEGVDSDSIVFHLPARFTIESLPDPVIITGLFGSYSARITLHGADLIYVRHFAPIDRKFQPDDYPAYLSFLKQISKADKSKCVGRKN